MTEAEKLIGIVNRCEEILAQVEKHAVQIESLHQQIEKLVNNEQNKTMTMDEAQEFKIKKELMKVAKKAAKKAAKKSLAIAQIRENLESANQSEE